MVRAQVLLAAHARGVLAIDTLHADFRDLDGPGADRRPILRRRLLPGCSRSIPARSPVINAAFTPGEDEIAAGARDRRRVQRQSRRGRALARRADDRPAAPRAGAAAAGAAALGRRRRRAAGLGGGCGSGGSAATAAPRFGRGGVAAGARPAACASALSLGASASASRILERRLGLDLVERQHRVADRAFEHFARRLRGCRPSALRRRTRRASSAKRQAGRGAGASGRRHSGQASSAARNRRRARATPHPIPRAQPQGRAARGW